MDLDQGQDGAGHIDLCENHICDPRSIRDNDIKELASKLLMPAFKLHTGQAWGAPAAGRAPWAGESMPARAAAAIGERAASRLHGDEEAEAEMARFT